MFIIKNSQWRDLNPGPLVWEATAVPLVALNLWCLPLSSQISARHLEETKSNENHNFPLCLFFNICRRLLWMLLSLVMWMLLLLLLSTSLLLVLLWSPSPPTSDLGKINFASDETTKENFCPPQNLFRRLLKK